MATIYQAYMVDDTVKPPKRTLIFEGNTEQETIAYLSMVGGLYRNVLHHFETCITIKESKP
jgi:hypothetical protein